MAALGPTILRKSTSNIDVTVRLEQQVSVVFVASVKCLMPLRDLTSVTGPETLDLNGCCSSVEADVHPEALKSLIVHVPLSFLLPD